MKDNNATSLVVKKVQLLPFGQRIAFGTFAAQKSPLKLMFGFGKLLSKELRFKLIKIPIIRKLIIWKNRKQHDNPNYSLIIFSRMFEVDWYLAEYPDVAFHKMDPIQHYINHGADEKRNPCSWFNTKIYADANNLNSSENPFLHFLLTKKKIEQIDPYLRWVEKYSTLTDSKETKIIEEIQQLKYQPLISVVIPVYNPDLKFLKKAIKSIRNQIYPNWEICIADDASTDQATIKYLKELQKKNENVKVKFRKRNGHISEATNSALEIATGEFIAFMDQDDLFSKDALYEMAKAINIDPTISLIYSDEDKINANEERFDPHFKSDWNQMLFYAQNYISHLTVIRKELVDQVGGLRKGYEGSQDYDLLLRILEIIDEQSIYHIPKILYHWRAVKGSTALAIDEKNYAVEAGRKALSEHIKKKFPNASVDVASNVFYKVNFPIPSPEPLVSIVIPFRDKVEFLKECTDSIFSKTKYRNFEMLLVDNNSSERMTHDFLSSIESNPQVKILQYKEEFNYSAINNYAVENANGEIILLLNNDISVISENWLEEMISYFSLDEVGAVGAKLLFDGNTIQHAGIILGIGGVAGHPHKFQKSTSYGYMSRAQLVQNLSAVTAACIAIRKSAYEKVGGLDEKLKVAFNDVDFCIRIRESGYKIVFTPFAQLYHYESKSRGNDNDPDKVDRFHSEIKFMQRRWGDLLKHDPYYNPNLSLQTEDFNLAFPPRKTQSIKLWK